METSNFFLMLIQKSVEKDDPGEVLVDTLGNHVGQIFILVGEKTQNLLSSHVQ